MDKVDINLDSGLKDYAWVRIAVLGACTISAPGLTIAATYSLVVLLLSKW
jgi:hypothetical protein